MENLEKEFKEFCEERGQKKDFKGRYILSGDDLDEFGEKHNLLGVLHIFFNPEKMEKACNCQIVDYAEQGENYSQEIIFNNYS
jgi:hypothetical protein